MDPADHASIHSNGSAPDAEQPVPSRAVIYFGPGYSSFGIPPGSAHIEPSVPRRVAAGLPAYTLCCLARDFTDEEVEALQERTYWQSSSRKRHIPWGAHPDETPPYLVHHALPPPFYALALDFMSSGKMLELVAPSHIRAYGSGPSSRSPSGSAMAPTNIDGRYPSFGSSSRRDVSWNSTATAATAATILSLPSLPPTAHHDVQGHPLRQYPSGNLLSPSLIIQERPSETDVSVATLPTHRRSASMESPVPKHRTMCLWITRKTGVRCGVILIILSGALGLGLIGGLAHLLNKLCEGPLNLRPH